MVPPPFIVHVRRENNVFGKCLLTATNEELTVVATAFGIFIMAEDKHDIPRNHNSILFNVSTSNYSQS
jgi:hypothetical protein